MQQGSFPVQLQRVRDDMRATTEELQLKTKKTQKNNNIPPTLSSSHAPVYVTPSAEMCVPQPVLISTPDEEILHSPSVGREKLDLTGLTLILMRRAKLQVMTHHICPRLEKCRTPSHFLQTCSPLECMSCQVTKKRDLC